MSASGALERSRRAIGEVLTCTTTGSNDRPRLLPRVDLALTHAEAWAADQPPKPALGDDGSSTTPMSDAERREIEQTKRRAAKAVTRIPQICRQVDTLMAELYSEVQWLTASVNPEKLPTVLPGCRSCARSGANHTGGHFAAIYEKAKSSGLCRFCYDCNRATGQLPSVAACDIYHRQGPRAAGLFMAKQQARAS